MKLWILRAIGDSAGECWDGVYNTNHGFVVRAKNIEDARKLCHDSDGKENHLQHFEPWLNPALTSCEELTTYGEEGIVLQDFYAG